MQIYVRTLENSVKKTTQRRKGTKQVKGNPVMYCSGNKTNKESLVHSLSASSKIKLKLLTLSSYGK